MYLEQEEEMDSRETMKSFRFFFEKKWTNRMTLVKIIFAFYCIGVSFICPSLASAEIDSSSENSNRPDMTLPDLTTEKIFDGLKLSEFNRFWEKWHLVTTRF